MKNRLFTLLVFLVVAAGCAQKQPADSDPQLVAALNHLVDTKDYFRLRAILQRKANRLSDCHARYYEAVVAQAFNEPEQSNRKIAELLGQRAAPLNDTLMKELYEVKLQNHIRLGEYQAAEQTNRILQEQYRALLDSSALDDLQNTRKIWHALADVPAQQVVRNRDFRIPMWKDKVGLFNITATVDGTKMDLIFDTGANFSVLRRSYVDKLGLQLIPVGFEVGALTGKQIKSDLAVADRLIIGGLTYRNVVFLVFDDKDLTIPQVDYHINGIIGFPVIAAMEELHIRKDSTLYVPKVAQPYTYHNLALDGLMPVVAVGFRADTLKFQLDTGAPNTALFAPFYRRYRRAIEKNHSKTVFKTGGAGGVVTFEGYVLDSIRLKIGSATARLDSLQLHIADIGGEEGYFDGNLGQDYIRQFDEMILSFTHASLMFD